MISNFLGRNISIPTNSFGAEDIFSLSLFAVCFPTHRRFTGSQYRKLRAQISVSLYLLSDIVNPKMAAREKKGRRKLVLSEIKRYLPASGCTVALQRLVTSCSRGLMPTVPSAAIWRPRGGNCFATVFRVSLTSYFIAFPFLLVQDLHNMYLFISCR